MVDPGTKGPAGIQGRSLLDEGQQRVDKYLADRRRLQKRFMIFLVVLFVLSGTLGWWVGETLILN